MKRTGKMHFVIPDCQVKPGHSQDYLESIGHYIVHKQPDRIICLGDFADMASLSTWDKGKKSFEGRRYQKDVAAVISAQERLLGPLREHNKAQLKAGKPIFQPSMDLTLGNHEDRIDRAVQTHPELDGAIGIDDLQYEKFGWKVHDYQRPVAIDGVMYCHFFTSGVMGRPVGTAAAMLTKKAMSCVAGHQQGYAIATGVRADGKINTAIIAGSCLEETHKVLTAKLDYVPLSTVEVGDKLVSFDEEAPARKRRYRTGTVVAVRTSVKDGFAVTLSDGKVFRVTEDHLWFVKAQGGTQYIWKRTDQLQETVGDRQGTKVPKLQEEWERLTSYEAGWLAGMYDGEGSLYLRHRSEGKAGAMQLSLSQKNGPTARSIMSRLQKVTGLGAVREQRTERDILNFRLRGGVRSIVQALGKLKPMRLINKFTPDHMGSVNVPDSKCSNVVSVVPCGPINVREILIDKGTMIVEGYGHHNCYEHDEDYLGPQGNKHWRGFLVLHDVRDGEFVTQWVSLDHAKRKFPVGGTKARRSLPSPGYLFDQWDGKDRENV